MQLVNFLESQPHGVEAIHHLGDQEAPGPDERKAPALVVHGNLAKSKKRKSSPRRQQALVREHGLAHEPPEVKRTTILALTPVLLGPESAGRIQQHRQFRHGEAQRQAHGVVEPEVGRARARNAAGVHQGVVATRGNGAQPGNVLDVGLLSGLAKGHDISARQVGTILWLQQPLKQRRLRHHPLIIVALLRGVELQPQRRHVRVHPRRPVHTHGDPARIPGPPRGHVHQQVLPARGDRILQPRDPPARLRYQRPHRHWICGAPRRADVVACKDGGDDGDHLKMLVHSEAVEPARQHRIRSHAVRGSQNVPQAQCQCLMDEPVHGLVQREDIRKGEHGDDEAQCDLSVFRLGCCGDFGPDRGGPLGVHQEGESLANQVHQSWQGGAQVTRRPQVRGVLWIPLIHDVDPSPVGLDMWQAHNRGHLGDGLGPVHLQG
mmetsp:Transcript_66864/g.178351  ORF Transcript_66864/g.178351 Transcript_66864/m.178351 type:complete len:434 (+) Transcript_66864:105-1406(+)